MPDRYQIFRYYIRDDRREILHEDLSWDEASKHLNGLETRFDLTILVESKYGPTVRGETAGIALMNGNHDGR
jgi:hypothetical protein